MRYFHGFVLMWCLVAALACEDRATTSSNAIDPEYERQMKETARQLEVSAKQLEVSAAQAERFEKLLQRWERQADREDRLLDARERQATQPAGGR